MTITQAKTEGFFIEHNGEFWQSVFPTQYADLSALHFTIEEAKSYMVYECGVSAEDITVRPREDEDDD